MAKPAFEELRNNWWWVLERLRTHSKTTELVLRKGRLESLQGSEITISFARVFYADLLNEPKRRLLVESVTERVMRRPFRLRYVQKGRRSTDFD